MKMIFVVIFIIFNCGLSFGKNSTELDTIIFANVLFRHGDRTPLDPYPNDPYNNESLWPVPFGQLTNLGKHEHLMLGRWLRKRYDHLLPKHYSLYDIYVESTDVDRTLMSAEANLAGLYTPIDDQVWDPLKWMPIPVHTVPEKNDYMLAGKKHCQRYNYEKKKLLKSNEFTKLMEQNKKLLDYLTQMTGRKINTLDQVEYIYNTLYIESLYNFTLPEWTKTIYPDGIKRLAELSFAIPAYNKILARLKIGTLIGQMTNNMVLKSQKKLLPDRKVWIYSAHDDTLANFLMGLNLFDFHCPPYAATVLVELRINKQSQYSVTISYKNSTNEPTFLTLPGCTSNCPLDRFVELTKDLVPDDWHAECNESAGPGENFREIITSAYIISLMGFVFSSIIIYLYVKKRSHQYYTRLGKY